METIMLKEFSRLVAGMWRLQEWGMTPDALYTFCRKCVDLGVTTFDHADIYGDYSNEARFGDMLAAHPEFRKAIQIITKCDIKMMSTRFPRRRVGHYDTSREHIIDSVDRSLQNLKTDYIDLLLIHRPDPLMDADETAGALQEVVQAGKVRYVGVSNFTPSQFSLLQSRLDMPLVTNKIEFSLLHWEPLLDGSLDHAQEIGISPMAWSPLGGGALFHAADAAQERLRRTLLEIGAHYGNLAIDQVALLWIMRHPSRILPVLGTGKIERVHAASKILPLRMEREHWFEILKAARGYDVP